MHWCTISAVALLVCLQIASDAYVSAQTVSYSVQHSEISQLKRRIDSLNRFMRRRADRVILTYGVESLEDYTFVRAITSVPLANGGTAIGVTLTNPQVLGSLYNNVTFTGNVDFFNTTYSAVFEPINSASGDVTGYFFAGIRV